MIALNYLNVTAVGPTVCVLAAAAGASVHIAVSRQTVTTPHTNNL